MIHQDWTALKKVSEVLVGWLKSNCCNSLQIKKAATRIDKWNMVWLLATRKMVPSLAFSFPFPFLPLLFPFLFPLSSSPSSSPSLSLPLRKVPSWKSLMVYLNRKHSDLFIISSSDYAFGWLGNSLMLILNLD